VTPEVIEKLEDMFGDSWVYEPEFLTEAKADWDFANATFRMFGGNALRVQVVSNLYRAGLGSLGIGPDRSRHIFCTRVEASLSKYAINSFLATKVLWFNQFKTYADRHTDNFQRVIEVISSDHRLGSSHMNVPGPDGKYGFGGACFPKDTAALYKEAGQDFTILGEVIARNNEIRSQYDLDSREKEQHVNYKVNS
jgi:UDPglucose 6-dehydrogenase